ncbi:MAG: hypothetical protein ACO230_03820 [Ilumatobacteraceae bacterium]
MSQTQSGFTVNFPHMLNEQSIHLAYLIAHLEQNGLTRVEVTAQAEEEWVRTIVNLAQNNIKFLEACTPGYYNNEGKPAARSLQSGSYGGGPVAFVKVLERWREQGELEGLEVS